MDFHDKECALAAYAILIERETSPVRRRQLRKEYNEIATACEQRPHIAKPSK